VTAQKLGGTIAYGDGAVTPSTGFGRNTSELLDIDLNDGETLYAIADTGQSGTVVFIAHN